MKRPVTTTNVYGRENQEVVGKEAFGTFRLCGPSGLVKTSPAVRTIWSLAFSSSLTTREFTLAAVKESVEGVKRR